MTPIVAAFAAGMRARRRELDMTQQTLADKARLDHVTVSRIENGRIGTSLVTASLIADALDTTVGALLGERHAQPDAVEVAAALGAVGKVMTDMAGWLAEKRR